MSGYTDFAAYYDLLQECSGTDYFKIADYYEKLLNNNGVNGGILLDLACGTGNLSRHFSSKGYDVISVDASVDMLNVAIKNPSPENSAIQYLCQDMTELDMFGTIDVCICTLDSLNHLTDSEELNLCFEKISLFMNSGGIFAFDVNTINKHMNILAGNTFVYNLEGFFFVWQNFYDAGEPNIIDVGLDFFVHENGVYRRSSDFFSECAFELFEIEELLKLNGFEVIACYDFLSFEEGNEDSEKVTFVARKMEY